MSKMPLSGMLTCGNCGARTQMNTMRYNLSGSKLICQNCIEKERSGLKPGTTHSMSARLRQEQMVQKTAATMPLHTEAAGDQGQNHTGPAEAGGEGMARYVCRSCHFKFSRKRDVEIGTCPYCGREAVSPAYEGKAQDLIEESAGMEDRMF
ncbi:hypothetical protein HYU40_02375 [Candidatus Woesearchaeota archaeon]|nr:hypothetical protein [Candidatus Woesearchaeota archaeon]